MEVPAVSEINNQADSAELNYSREVTEATCSRPWTCSMGGCYAGARTSRLVR
jgi:hypothetical protein